MKGIAEPRRLTVLVHELRSPVAALSAISGTLADERLEGADLGELARLAISACRSIERLVVDAATTSIQRERVDVAALVRQVVAAAALGGARVEPKVAVDIPSVVGDRVRLRQALDNLVVNALTHSGSDDRVVVSAVASGRQVLLAVADSGVGIPSDEQARILEAGVRLRQDRPGSGLGLTIVRAIAEAHRGTLTVTSEPGGGATFTIALPIDE